MDNELTIYKEVIALTGSSGSGKSTVAKMLRDLGAHIVSADEFSREAVAKGSVALEELVAEFGPESVLETGDLDRKFLRYAIFSDSTKKKKVEAIIHPKVKALAIKAFKSALEANSKPIIYDVPLYFEAGLDKLPFKGVILIYADDDVCIQRIMQRDNLSQQEAEIRLKNQLPSEEKMKGATYIINNSGSLADLEMAVRQLWEAFK